MTYTPANQFPEVTILYVSGTDRCGGDIVKFRSRAACTVSLFLKKTTDCCDMKMAVQSKISKARTLFRSNTMK